MNTIATAAIMPQTYKLAMRKPSALVLLFLISFGSIGAVMFTPSLPNIGQYFHVGSSTAQLTVTAYLIGYALGQLPYGPLANRFGRKKTIMIGVVLEIIGAILSVLAAPTHAFSLLIFARFLTALGACVGLMMSFTIISDYFHEQQARVLISYLLTAFAIMPGLSVALGGVLTSYFGWISCFYFLIAYGVVIALMTLTLPETAIQLNHKALALTSIVQSYKKAFKNKKLIVYAMIMGGSTAGTYLFSGMAPFINAHFIGLTSKEYGLFNLIPSAGFLVGGLISAKMARFFAARTAILLGIITAILGAFSLLLLFMQLHLSAWDLFLPIAFVQMCNTLVFPNASTLATQNSDDKSTASAVMNFLNLSTAVIFVFIGGIVPLTHAVVFPILLLLIFMGMLVVYKKTNSA